jgi:glycosyltransferase involved in cell wall biosynthesis
VNCNPKNGVSIILPAYNEEKYVGEVLTCLIKVMQTSDVANEIIVVDNGSSDSTKSIVSTFPVKLVNCDIKGAAACRNLGVTHALFDKIAFLDSDCLVGLDWIENIVLNLAKENNAAYGGPCTSPKNGSWVEKAWAPEEIITDSYGESLLAGCNFSVRKENFFALGGFKEELLTAEDDDLSRRINNSEFKCIRDTKQAVVHLGYPKTLKESFKKVLWHGTTQFKAHGLFSDKMVMLTVIWIFFVLSSLFTLGNEVLFVCFTSFVFLILPALLVIKRLSLRRITLHEIAINYALTMVTLFARSIGLVMELYGIAKNRLFLNKEKG